MIVYKITNKVNNKIYIGISTVDSKERWLKHLSDSRRKPKQSIDRAIKKYGEQNFKYEVIEKIPFLKGIKFLENREIFYISKFKSTKNTIGYNRSLGGNVNVGRIVTKVHKSKSSKSQPTSKEIYAYDFDGKLKKIYTNLKEASDKNSVSKGAIQKVINKKNRQSAGYQWRKYENNIPLKKITVYIKTKSKTTQVFQWDRKGIFIKKFNSINEASKATGSSTADIDRVLNGVNIFSKGFHWSKDRGKNNIRKKKLVIGGNNQVRKIKVNVYSNIGKYIETLESITLAAKKYGCDPSEISKCILEKKRAHRFKDGKVLQFKKDSGSKKNISSLAKDLHNKKPILMYDLRGNYLKTFESTALASRATRIPRGTIRHCLKGRMLQAGNYIWKYQSNNFNNKITPYKNKKVPVLQYDFNGRFIKEFKSIAEASEALDTNPANIQRCIDGKGYSSNGYYWFKKEKSKIQRNIKTPIFLK